VISGRKKKSQNQTFYASKEEREPKEKVELLSQMIKHFLWYV